MAWLQRMMDKAPALPWRQPRLESGPITLTARRLYILPTRQGLLFAVLLVALLWGSANYSLSLGYLFTFLLAGVGTVTMLHTQRNLSGLVLRAESVHPVYAGEAAAFRLQVDGRGRDRFGLLLAQGGAAAHALGDIHASNEHLTLDIPQPRRGYHRPGRLSLASTYPLGLFRCWTVFNLKWGALVYPSPAQQPLPLPPPSGPGEGGGQRHGEEAFDGLRPYQAGDSLRRIAWKQVARGQGLLTKQFAGEAGGVLWLEWNLVPERDLEARLSRLTRWALDAETQGQVWGLRLPTRQIPPARGEIHLRQCLEALALYGHA
jgi:uncharacterized protein (DUF58 family)